MAFAEVCILLSTGIENQTFGRYCWWDFVPARGWSSEWLILDPPISAYTIWIRTAIFGTVFLDMIY